MTFSRMIHRFHCFCFKTTHVNLFLCFRSIVCFFQCFVHGSWPFGKLVPHETPLPLGNYCPLTPPPPWNFQWSSMGGGYGYFLEPHNTFLCTVQIITPAVEKGWERQGIFASYCNASLTPGNFITKHQTASINNPRKMTMWHFNLVPRLHRGAFWKVVIKSANLISWLYWWFAGMSVENRGNGQTWRMPANLIADIWHARYWRFYTPIAGTGENRNCCTGHT